MGREVAGFVVGPIITAVATTCVERVWRSNGSLFEVNNVLAAVPVVKPCMSGRLRLSWKPQKTWLKLEPNTRALPLPPLLAAAFVGAFCWWKPPRPDVR